jgi:hypothetical protein
MRTLMPSLFANEADPTVTFLAKTNSFEVVFLTIQDADNFANEVAECIALTVEFENGIGGTILFPVKIKHVEPYGVRRRKYAVSRAWEAIQDTDKAANGNRKLIMTVTHYSGTSSYEASDLVVRPVWTVSSILAHGGFAHSRAEALAVVAGFNSGSYDAIEATIAIAMGPRR